jgi:transposase, IS30 family
MGRPRLPLDVRVLARALLAEGVSQVEAGRVAGIGRRSVQRLVAEAGGMPPRRIRNCGSLRLSALDREEIRAGIERSESFRQIGRRLGRAASTVSREVNRNGGRDGYRAWAAGERAAVRAQRPKLAWYQRRPDRWVYIQGMLRLGWSPQQIAARIKTDHPYSPELWVSHETIYRSIYVQGRGQLRKELAACLRSGRARRRPHPPARRARGGIKDKVMISVRPPQVEDRSVPGHWEGDLIIGANGATAIATLVERSTRFGMLIKLENRTAEHVSHRISQHITTLPTALTRSLTWDQGNEMAGHARFTIKTGIPVFFCDPHSPWQRGSNENFNGLLRQYLPKGTPLTHTQNQLDHIADLLNGRPRQTLNWMTPSERLNQLLR